MGEEVPALASERMSPTKGAAHATSTDAGYLDIRELAEPRSADDSLGSVMRS
jgi:hypothetical protein